MDHFEIIEGFLACKACWARSPKLSEARIISVAAPNAVFIKCDRCGVREFVLATELPIAVIPSELLEILDIPKKSEGAP